MHRHLILRRAAIFAVAATAGVVALLPARAQTPGLIATPAALTSPAPRPPACVIAAEQVRFDVPLVRMARLLASGKPIKIVALGSSSTFGAGASTSAASYPSRLAEELSRHFPGHEITVLNRGVNGEEAADMLKRLDLFAPDDRPDVVLWQVGTNAVLRDNPLGPVDRLINEGLGRMKALGADVVLIDPQFAPKVLVKPETEGMVGVIAAAATKRGVDLFPRFAVMREWHETEGIPFEAFLSPDLLHMNDWGYACFAKLLGAAMAEAVTRPVAAARAAPRP